VPIETTLISNITKKTSAIQTVAIMWKSSSSSWT